jgi:DNA-binding transcriptional regulator YiaG
MNTAFDNFPGLVKMVRSQLGISQEELARELRVSFATVNRWENGKVKPSKMARTVFRAFCQSMVQANKLNLPGVEL